MPEAYFSRGDKTLKVPMSLFEDNRKNLLDKLRSDPQVGSLGKSCVLLQGGVDVPFNDTDINWPFRQESFFQWAFGVEEPECYGAMDLESGRSILFVPRLPEEYETWMGKISSPEEFRVRYAVDEVRYTDELASFFAKKNVETLLVLHGVNSDSGLTSKEVTFDGIENRVIKTAKELEVLRYVCRVSSEAHKVVMRQMRPGMREYEAESAFLHHVYSVGGCRHVSYTCICSTGQNSAVLHYGHAGAPNSKAINDGDMCLFDMGGNYCGYAADITCSFPANGKFTADQRMVYNAVLDARNAVLKAARPGVLWSDMHLLANRVMLEALKRGGLLVGDVDDMMRANLNAVFQPHGLGHFLGLDVHDVGGYLPANPQRSTRPGLNKLRTSRKLLAGMFLTVEPGCYFINRLLDKAQEDKDQSKFIVWDELAKYRGWGGVRIEDDVLITETGVENFTDVPRTVEEIEEFMKGN